MSGEGIARRVYIAGPDVFLPNATEALARKKAVCARYGLQGVTPFDSEVALDPARQREVAKGIYEANRDFMRSCNWCIANATPFRGVSVDPGTAFEIGYMCASGKTVFAYTTDRRRYEERVADATNSDPLVKRHTEGGWVTEAFTLHENLMLPFGVEESGGEFLVVGEGESEDAVFLRCVEAIAARAGATRPFG